MELAFDQGMTGSCPHCEAPLANVQGVAVCGQCGLVAD